MKYVISVSKTYKHRGNHRHKRAKKHWFVYYYDEDWKLHCDQINWFQALCYKAKKLHRIRRVCNYCGIVSISLVKSKKEEVECPNCYEIIEH